MSKFAKLEKLIDDYEAAIVAPEVDVDEVNRLCLAVEKEAERTGYDNHRLLKALHTTAEAVLGDGVLPWEG